MNIHIKTSSAMTNISGMGPAAWNHGGQAVHVIAMHHMHHEPKETDKYTVNHAADYIHSPVAAT